MRYRRGESEIAGLRERRRSRTTGTVVSIYEANEAGFDPEGGRWVTMCEDHGTLCNHATLAEARYHLAMCEWCEDCLASNGTDNISVQHATAAIIDVIRAEGRGVISTIRIRQLACVAATVGLAPELMASAEGRQALEALTRTDWQLIHPSWGTWTGFRRHLDTFEGPWRAAMTRALAYFDGNRAASRWKTRYDIEWKKAILLGA